LSYLETPKINIMIKKLLLTSALFITGIMLLNAQCTPNTSCTALVCPDTIINLPNAQKFIAYSTTMTFAIPATYPISATITANIDSIKLTSITGLPSGLYYLPNTSDSTWAKNKIGCILISGTPDASVTLGGIYPLLINTYGWGKVSGFPANSALPAQKGYRIKIDSTSGIATFEENKFSVKQNSPNPFSGKTTIIFNSPNNDKCSFAVINVIGEKVFEKTINAITGENKIEFSAGELPSGIYMYKLSNKEQTITKRMIVAGK